jgi:hypothetical protein
MKPRWSEYGGQRNCGPKFPLSSVGRLRSRRKEERASHLAGLFKVASSVIFFFAPFSLSLLFLLDLCANFRRHELEVVE